MTPTSEAGPSAVGRRCPNCTLPLPDVVPRFCPGCGQATTLHSPTFFEFVHEFVGHYVALEGALWATLRLLFTRPGELTRAYLDGRRRQYVLPLRLFLSASFVFFLVMKLAAPFASVTLTPASIEADAPEPGSACTATTPEHCSKIESWVMQRMRAHESPERWVAAVRGRMAGSATYVAIAMAPVLAGLLQLMFRRTRRNYGEHFVFALHVLSFVFLAMALAAAVPWVGVALVAAVPAYMVVALRHVHGLPWFSTVWRAALVGVLHLLAMGVVTLVAATMSVMLA